MSNEKELRTLGNLLDVAYKHDLEIEVCSDNFLIVDSTKTYDILEAHGINLDDFEWGYNDEYVQCSNCGEHIALYPGYNGDIIDYAVLDYDYVCGDCIRSDEMLIDDYINTIIDNSGQADTVLTDRIIENLGFKDHFCDFENGFHPGQTDDPVKILIDVMSKHPEKEFMFKINDTSMFNIHFTLLSRIKEE